MTDIRPPGAYYAVYLTGHDVKPCVDVLKLAACLPHGAGINSDWTIDVKRNGDVTCYGSYHAMNDSGYYTGWHSFRIRIKRATRTIYNSLTGPWLGQYQVTHIKGKTYLDGITGGGDAKDYLWDTCSSAILDSLGIRIMDSIVVDSEIKAKTAQTY